MSETRPEARPETPLIDAEENLAPAPPSPPPGGGCAPTPRW
ncbi:hypothetical protein ACFQ2B_16110 [Streptomyces stramineus]